MKPDFILKICLAATILVVGCQGTEVEPLARIEDKTDLSISSSMKVTKTHLNLYLNNIKGISETRSSDVSVDPILNDIDTVMYLVNYPDGGWEVLSADVRVPTRLMFSECGTATLSEIEANPGLSMIIQDYKDKISAVKHSEQTTTVTGATTLWENLIYNDPQTKSSDITWLQIGRELVSSENINIPHLISTHWDQKTYNLYVPYTTPQKNERCVTGCTIVAAAQVANYLQAKFNFVTDCVFLECLCNTYISSGGGSTLYGSFIPNTSTAQTNTNYWRYVRGELGTAQQQKQAISVLMAVLGYRLNATYSYSYSADDAKFKAATTAEMYGIPDVFENMYDIECTSVDGSIYNAVVAEQIQDGLPVIVQGFEPDGPGHAWIIDGYYLNKQVYNYHYQGFDPSNPSTPIYKTVQEIEEYDEYLLANWGAGASFDSNTYFIGTYTWSVADYTFSTRFGMIYNFRKMN